MTLALFQPVLDFGVLAVAARYFHIGRGHGSRRSIPLAFALGIHYAEVMLGMLIQILRRDTVAAGLRLTSQRDIALEHLIGATANFNAWAVAVEDLLAVRLSRSVMLMRRPTATSAASPIAAA